MRSLSVAGSSRHRATLALAATQGRPGKRLTNPILAVLLLGTTLVVLTPTAAMPHEWQKSGTGGAQLKVTPDGYSASDPIHDDDTLSQWGSTVTVEGREFPPEGLARVFQCYAGETDPLRRCGPIGAVPVASDGTFSTQVLMRSGFVRPDGSTGACASSGTPGTQCSVVAATVDLVDGEVTAMAEHYICFLRVTGCRRGPTDPTATTTSTTSTTLPPLAEWEPAPSMITPRLGLATVVAPDGRIYALGGNDGDGNALASVEVFDPCGSRRWKPVAPMPAARTRLAAAAGVEGRIYAIGGRDSDFGTALSTVDVYDPATNSWSSVARLAVPRAELAAATGSDGRIYAIGGHIGPTPSSMVEVYDQAANAWVPAPPMLSARADHAVATGPDARMYAIGGYSGLVQPLLGPFPRVESYAPGPAGTPGVWKPAASIVTVPPQMAVTSGPDGLIHGTGGLVSANTEAIRISRTYDTVADTWRESTEAMLSRRTIHGAATGRDGSIYSIGGTDDPIPDDPDLDHAQPLSSVEFLKVGPNNCPRLTQPADFDGDFDTDVSVFRPDSGTWFAQDGDTVNYGAQGDIPVPADYDGDQVTDVAIFRPSVGLWAIHRSSDDTDVFVTYGIGTDVPVPADYDGDAKADIAIFRPEFALWWYRSSSTGLDVPTTFGIATDTPVPVDYDGDARADIAVFRAGTWFTLPSAGGSYLASAYGAPGDIPVPADYDADRVIDRAVFRPTDGSWSLNHSSDGTDETFTFGVSGDVPVPGDYNGDRISDPALFRPSSGQWLIETGETHRWGLSPDIPLPLPYAIRRTHLGGTP